jgi:hypothetical protein
LPGPPAAPQVAPLVLTFTGGAGGNWNVPQTVFVTATDDLIAEGPHTGTITHAAASTDVNYNAIAVVDVVPLITDNDSPAGVTVTPVTLDVGEGAFDDSYQVVLNSDPGAGVTITITPNPGTQLSVSPSALTFTGGPAGTWSVFQTVTVSAVNDGVVEGPHTATIAHVASSSNPASPYNGLAVASVLVNITDGALPGGNGEEGSYDGSDGGKDAGPGPEGEFGLGGRVRRTTLLGPIWHGPHDRRAFNVSHRPNTQGPAFDEARNVPVWAVALTGLLLAAAAVILANRVLR